MCIALQYMTRRANLSDEEWFEPEEHTRVFLITRPSALRALDNADADAADTAQHRDARARARTPWHAWSSVAATAVEAPALRLADCGAHATLHERLFVFASGAVAHLDFNPHRVRGRLGGAECGRGRRACALGGVEVEALCADWRSATLLGGAEAAQDLGRGAPDDVYEDGDDGDDGDDDGGDYEHENRNAAGGGGDCFTVKDSEGGLPYRCTRLMLPGDSVDYFGTERIVRVVVRLASTLPGMRYDSDGPRYLCLRPPFVSLFRADIWSGCAAWWCGRRGIGMQESDHTSDDGVSGQSCVVRLAVFTSLSWTSGRSVINYADVDASLGRNFLALLSVQRI
jgi:hypothetical protein